MSGKRLVVVAERPILFSGAMVRAILAGTKTQTRRLFWSRDGAKRMLATHVTPLATGVEWWAEPFGWEKCPYGLPGDRLLCYHCAHDYYASTSTHPGLAERRLPGGLGRADLQSDEVRWIRAQGEGALVSAEGTRQPEGLPNSEPVSSERQGDDVGASVGVHGLPWRASDADLRDKALGRESCEQPAGESPLGDGSRELARQADPRNSHDGRTASRIEIHGRGARAHSLGREPWAMQPEAGGPCAGCDSVVDSRHRVGGSRLWVRETWLEFDRDHWAHTGQPKESVVNERGDRNAIAYRANTGEDGEEIRRQYGYRWRPSIHMPRWASRITLEVTGVGVQRLQEINDWQILAEGMPAVSLPQGSPLGRAWFREVWDSINGKRAPWDSNPWVWCLSFKRLA